MLFRSGDRLLLTRYRGRPFKKYALIAGFNEIGETIEQTVHREVLEEAGVRVKNLRFYKSQPWVFTDTLLMGFVCELDGSDRITVQESELAEASWHLRSELPQDHSYISPTGDDRAVPAGKAVKPDIDRSGESRYTGDGSLDRVNALGLRVRLAAFSMA